MSIRQKNVTCLMISISSILVFLVPNTFYTNRTYSGLENKSQ